MRPPFSMRSVRAPDDVASRVVGTSGNPDTASLGHRCISQNRQRRQQNHDPPDLFHMMEHPLAQRIAYEERIGNIYLKHFGNIFYRLD